MNLEEIKEIYADKAGRLFEACHSGELIDMGARLIAEIERLREYSAEYVQQRDECGIAQKTLNLDYLYQRRHRKWALQKARRWHQNFLLAGRVLGQNVRKAEAELVLERADRMQAETERDTERKEREKDDRRAQAENRRLQERVRELRGALEETSERTLADGTLCWCDTHPDYWAEQHKTEHSSWCIKARQALQHKEGSQCPGSSGS